MINVVILISGSGSNLQAIIDATKKGLPVTIAAVISNRSDAFGLERARNANIPTHMISHKDFSSRHDFDNALREQIDAYQPDVVALAGFMRRLESDFVAHYRGKLINIHPSLLPKHPGLHTHQQVLEAGGQEHGATIHFVTDELDAGPMICQAKLTVLPQDTEETLKARVQVLEHKMYPKVLSWMAKQRLKLKGHEVWLDDKRLPETGKLLSLR